MATNDIDLVQIIATTKDATLLIAESKDEILIQCIASLCQFVLLKKDLFREVSLKELMENKT